MKKMIPIVLTTIFINSCSTPYVANGLMGGYSDMQLNNNTYIVSFRGNGFTDKQTVYAYLLRRSAELTLAKGYKYFIIVNEDDSVDTSEYVTPTTVDASSSSNYMGFGSIYSQSYGGNYNLAGFGNTNSYATIHPGQRYTINRITSRVMVKMFKSNNKAPNALDAKLILRNFIKTDKK